VKGWVEREGGVSISSGLGEGKGGDGARPEIQDVSAGYMRWGEVWMSEVMK